MSDIKKIEMYLKHLDIKISQQRDQGIYGELQDILKETQSKPSAVTQPKIRGNIMRSRITKFAAAAVIVIGVIIGINQLGTPFDANKVYADMANRIKQARTFSCINIREGILRNGQKYVDEKVFYFKEPDLERHESRTYLGGELDDEEITITDYAVNNKLILDGIKKQAEFQENFIPYTIDAHTGELVMKEVENSYIYYIRNRVIRLGERGAVEDLGKVELEGRLVRKLQATGEYDNTIVWIDPQNNLPLQIEIRVTNSDNRLRYNKIQIDEELDDELFSMDVSENYSLEVTKRNWPIEKMEIAAKMQFLHSRCCMHANEFWGGWPDKLNDLVPRNIKSIEVLKTILAAAGHPEGDPLIRYQAKRQGDSEQKVIFYELFEQWPDNGAMVCFNTGEPKLITDQEEFEALIR